MRITFSAISFGFGMLLLPWQMEVWIKTNAEPDHIHYLLLPTAVFLISLSAALLVNKE